MHIKGLGVGKRGCSQLPLLLFLYPSDCHRKSPHKETRAPGAMATCIHTSASRVFSFTAEGLTRTAVYPGLGESCGKSVREAALGESSQIIKV